MARKEMARLWKEMGLGGEEEEQQQPEQAAERAESAESAGGYDADEPEEAGALSGALLRFQREHPCKDHAVFSNVRCMPRARKCTHACCWTFAAACLPETQVHATQSKWMYKSLQSCVSLLCWLTKPWDLVLRSV